VDTFPSIGRVTRLAPVDHDEPNPLVCGDDGGEAPQVQPQLEFDRLQEHFRDPIQRRYEVIRPLVLFQDRTATERAQEIGMHPKTVSRLKRRFEKQGMLGLFPDTVEVLPSGREGRVKEAVIEELAYLKSLYDGFGYRELCRIIFCKVEERISDKTVKKLWHQLPPAAPVNCRFSTIIVTPSGLRPESRSSNSINCPQRTTGMSPWVNARTETNHFR
jgi:transposase